MKKLLLTTALCISLALPNAAHATVAANYLRAMIRNDTNSGNDNIDQPMPTVNSFMTVDVNSTDGRTGSGTGSYREMAFGSGLCFDSAGSQVTVCNVPTASITGLSTALSGKQNSSSALTEYAGITLSNGTVLYRDNTGTLTTFTLGTAAGANISSFATAAQGAKADTALQPGGNATTATALAANGSNCSAGSYATGVDASGNAEGCTAIVSGTRTFNYPSRTLASCFQVSNTLDAEVNYSVDITAGLLTLGGGTGVVTSYTNSSCTAGAQILFNGAVSSVALSGISSIPLHAIAKANTWLKVTGTGTGGGTATIDAIQAETLLP